MENPDPAKPDGAPDHLYWPEIVNIEEIDFERFIRGELDDFRRFIAQKIAKIAQNAQKLAAQDLFESILSNTRAKTPLHLPLAIRMLTQ